MDDLRMIRHFLEEPPPSAEVVAEGRRRLTGGARPARRARRHPWRIGAAGLAMAAAATAAALVVTMSGPPAPGHAPGRRVGPERLTARQILLTAAQKAAAAPTGRYWHTHVINGQAYHVARGDYVITGARMEIDQWLGRSDRDADVFRSRFAGALPQTAADRAAWRRAGSPANWRVWSNGQWIRQTATPEKWDLVRTTPMEKAGERRLERKLREECGRSAHPCPGGAKLTQAQREALAGDPAALRKRLATVGGKGGLGSLLTNAGTFLADPSSPELQAAVFRVLADTPGIRNLGTITDVRGRSAIALAARSSYAGETLDTELLLRPGTYELLGTQTVLVSGHSRATDGMAAGTVFTYELFLARGWTESAP